MHFVTQKVSIPHRYGKNLAGALEKHPIDEEFPFLIGTVRTHLHFTKLQRQASFHSS